MSRPRFDVQRTHFRAPTWWPVVWLCLVFLGWLLPAFWTGTKHGYVELFPPRWRFQHAVAGLFTDREASWNQPVFLVKTAGLLSTWREVERGWLSRSELAGYRNRMDRLVPMVRRGRAARTIFGRMGQFVAEQVGRHSPQWGQVVAVRIVNTNWSSRLPEMMKPAGIWELPPFHEIDPARITEVVLIQLEGGRVQSVRLGSDGVKAVQSSQGDDRRLPAAVKRPSLRIPGAGSVPQETGDQERAHPSDGRSVKR